MRARSWPHRHVLLHTHLAENHGEIAAVAAQSVFAHCIHMSDRAMARMAEAGAGIAHCPTSNLFLGLGLFDLAQADRHGVRVGIGSDIGAGTTFSIPATLGEAYKVAQLSGATHEPLRALHLATAGGAAVMGLADRIGGLQPGQEADFVVLDPAATPLLARRTRAASLADTLFALQILGDDRAVERTYVAGKCRHRRNHDRAAAV